MSELAAEIYRETADIAAVAAFAWDIRADTLIYDDMLEKILLRQLPTKGINQALANPRLVHPKDREAFRERMNLLLAGTAQGSAPTQDVNVEFRCYIGRRQYIWLHLGYRAHYEEGRCVRVVGFLQNASSRRQEKDKLQAAMEKDPMTGLYSKTHSASLVERAIADPATQHALLVIDMDNFKQVNDKLGHLIGDAVILDVALNLKQVFRPTDVLGHIGGDEFMVLMKDIITPDIVQEKCRQLRDLLRKSYTQGSEKVSVSASIGIALAPLHGTDYQTLFSHADAALYQGKKKGKDSQIVYDSSFKSHRDRETGEESTGSQDYQKLIASPLEYIFHMVMKSQDTSLAVQILLEIFAKHFKVQRAYVLWHVDGQYWAETLFDYAAKGFTPVGTAHNAEVRRRMRKRYRDTNYGRFTECEDTGQLSQQGCQVFQDKQIYAFLECAVMDEENFLGCVGFDDCEGPRIWSRAEHEVLHAFAEIMRRFLLGQMYYERMKKSSIWGF